MFGGATFFRAFQLVEVVLSALTQLRNPGGNAEIPDITVTLAGQDYELHALGADGKPGVLVLTHKGDSDHPLAVLERSTPPAPAKGDKA